MSQLDGWDRLAEAVQAPFARPLVYICGPYSHPDPVANTHVAIGWAEAVEALGCDVVIPHLSLLWHVVSPAPVERWYERDNALLVRCDALFRIAGESHGAAMEESLAIASGLPVFRESAETTHQLAEWIAAWS